MVLWLLQECVQQNGRNEESEKGDKIKKDVELRDIVIQIDILNILHCGKLRILYR